MKHLLGFCLVLCLSTAHASFIVKEGFRIFDTQKDYLPQIKLRKDLTIDNMDSSGYMVYGPEGLHEWLSMNNVPFESEKKEFLDSSSTKGYMSHDEMKDYLFKLQKKYPDLMEVSVFGKSAKNRDLFAVKISKNVHVDEVEPEFKYIANMHGDEIVGRELTLRFMEELLSSYGTNEEITSLIDNTEIFIIPTLNPDGMTLKQRGNGNYVDINRDFPRFGEETTEGRASETIAMMNFQKAHHFSLSANYHGGAVVVNYPWDSIETLPPLNDFIVDLSSEYASHNNEMKTSTEFPGGITNGYAWYEVAGGMQDWSYYFYDDLQLTLEVSQIKWANYLTIDSYYRDNRDSMVSFLKRVHEGAGLKIEDKNFLGKVQVIDSNSKMIGEYPFKGGEFYKVLPEGNYTFKLISENVSKDFPVRVYKDKIFSHGNFIEVE